MKVRLKKGREPGYYNAGEGPLMLTPGVQNMAPDVARPFIQAGILERAIKQPQRVKPRLYTRQDVWEMQGGEGFLLVRGVDGREIRAGARESAAAAARLAEIAARGGRDALPLGSD